MSSGLYGPLEVLLVLKDLEEERAPLSRSGYELVKSSYLTNEMLNLLGHLRRIHFLNHSNILQICLNASMQDHKVMEFLGCNSKCTLH